MHSFGKIPLKGVYSVRNRKPSQELPFTYCLVFAFVFVYCENIRTRFHYLQNYISTPPLCLPSCLYKIENS